MPTTTTTDDKDGTVVAGGNHVVPDGVAVEELDGGKKKLAEICPPRLATLLASKKCRHVYDKLVQAIVQESNTRSVFGKWRDEEFVSILELFQQEFAEHGIQVALCKRKSGSGTFRWLEFMDVDRVGHTYVPQFNVANRSGQVIRTCYTKVEFPHGVAVEELKQWGKARRRLKEKMPVYVEQMMTEKGLLDEYNALVEHVANDGVGQRLKQWNMDKLKEIVHAHEWKFQAKGVDVYVSHKQEYISHGKYGGHTEYFRWIEFVDRSQQPNYHPQRDADSKSEPKCVVM